MSQCTISVYFFQKAAFESIVNISTTTVLWSFVRDYSGEPILEETFTHSYLSWSSIILYQLLPSTTIH